MLENIIMAHCLIEVLNTKNKHKRQGQNAPFFMSLIYSKFFSILYLLYEFDSYQIILTIFCLINEEK